MGSFRKLVIPVLCVAIVCGAAGAWRAYQARTTSQAEPVQDATALRQRAEQGDATAQSALASLYSKGKGVSLDYAEALRWYRKAADQGNARAENGLGLMYMQGEGVPQDYDEAVRWYRKAADQGYKVAEYNLGNMYYYGRGVSLNRAEAQQWYRKAADQGDEYAQRALGLRGGFSIGTAIALWLFFIGSMLSLKDAILRKPNARYPQPRAFTLGGVCGLVYVGLSLYAHFTVFNAVSTANIFHFLTNLMAGVAVATYITIFGRKAAKVALGISGALLLMNGVIAVISRHQLARLMTVRSFSSISGLAIGMAGTLVLFLWLQRAKTDNGTQAGNSEFSAP